MLLSNKSVLNLEKIYMSFMLLVKLSADKCCKTINGLNLTSLLGAGYLLRDRYRNFSKMTCCWFPSKALNGVVFVVLSTVGFSGNALGQDSDPNLVTTNFSTDFIGAELTLKTTESINSSSSDVTPDLAIKSDLVSKRWNQLTSSIDGFSAYLQDYTGWTFAPSDTNPEEVVFVNAGVSNKAFGTFEENFISIAIKLGRLLFERADLLADITAIQNDEGDNVITLYEQHIDLDYRRAAAVLSSPVIISSLQAESLYILANTFSYLGEHARSANLLSENQNRFSGSNLEADVLLQLLQYHFDNDEFDITLSYVESLRDIDDLNANIIFQVDYLEAWSFFKTGEFSLAADAFESLAMTLGSLALESRSSVQQSVYEDSIGTIAFIQARNTEISDVSQYLASISDTVIFFDLISEIIEVYTDRSLLTSIGQLFTDLYSDVGSSSALHARHIEHILTLEGSGYQELALVERRKFSYSLLNSYPMDKISAQSGVLTSNELEFFVESLQMIVSSELSSFKTSPPPRIQSVGDVSISSAASSGSAVSGSLASGRVASSSALKGTGSLVNTAKTSYEDLADLVLVMAAVSPSEDTDALRFSVGDELDEIGEEILSMTVLSHRSAPYKSESIDTEAAYTLTLSARNQLLQDKDNSVVSASPNDIDKNVSVLKYSANHRLPYSKVRLVKPASYSSYIGNVTDFVTRFPTDLRSIDLTKDLITVLADKRRVNEIYQLLNDKKFLANFDVDDRFDLSRMLVDTYIQNDQLASARVAIDELLLIPSRHLNQSRREQYTDLQEDITYQLAVSIAESGRNDQSLLDSREMQMFTAKDRNQGHHTSEVVRTSLVPADNGYLEYLSLYPDGRYNNQALYGLGVLYFDKQLWEAAAAKFAEWSIQYPNINEIGDVYNRLLICYENLGSKRQYADTLIKVASVTGKSIIAGNAVFEAAQNYEEIADSELAITTYETYLRDYQGVASKRISALSSLAAYYVQSSDALLSVLERTARYYYELSSNNFPLTNNDKILLSKALYDYGVIQSQKTRGIQLDLPLTNSLAIKNKAVKENLTVFKEVLDLNVLNMRSATTYEMAQLYAQFADALLASPVPSDLDEFAAEEYVFLLEDKAFPLQELAIKLHEENIKRLRGKSLNSRYELMSLNELKRLVPGRYDKSSEKVRYVENMF